jgi:hypothetical protein
MRWDFLNGPTFNIHQAYIAPWLGPGLWGPAVEIPAVNLVTGSGKVVSKQLEGRGRIEDVASVLTEGTGQVKFGGISLAILKILTGWAYSDSGSTPNRIRQTKFSVGNLPYWGLTASVYVNAANGLVQLFVPKGIISSDFMVAGASQYAYTLPDLKVEFVADDGYTQGGTTAVQTVTLSGTPSSGTFTLTFNNATTTPINYAAAASAVQSALEALSTIGTGNVTVTGSAGGPYTVTFAGQLVNMFQPTLIPDSTLLVGGTAHVVATTPGETPSSTWLSIVEFETAPGGISLPPALN